MWKISFKVETVGPRTDPIFGGVYTRCLDLSQIERVERLCLTLQRLARKYGEFGDIEEQCVAFLQQRDLQQDRRHAKPDKTPGPDPAAPGKREPLPEQTRQFHSGIISPHKCLSHQECVDLMITHERNI